MAFPEKIIGFFQELVAKLTRTIEPLVRGSRFWNNIHNLTGKKKKHFIIICTAAVVVLLVLSVLLSLRGSARQDRSVEPQRANRLTAIPPGELFLPGEPDFIPGVVLERERRLRWTEEDASEYWQDPLRGGEEPWREKIEEAVDEFMERIP